MKKISFLIICYTLLTATGFGQSETTVSAEELARQLSNPVASLISVPFQNNLDVGIGPLNGSRNTLNFQPVIPISLTSEFHLITRLVAPFVTQHDISGAGAKESGLSDAVASAFFSPVKVKNGLVWGVGPVLLLPIATNDLLGTKKLGIGPTALVLKQTNGWTLGLLANQIWSIAGDKNRADVSQLFCQPFVSFNWKSGAGIGMNSEITQNWVTNNTSVFITPTVSGVTSIGNQRILLAVGPRYQVAAPGGNRAAFGVRAVLVLVFPK